MIVDTTKSQKYLIIPQLLHDVIQFFASEARNEKASFSGRMNVNHWLISV